MKRLDPFYKAADFVSRQIFFRVEPFAENAGSAVLAPRELCAEAERRAEILHPGEMCFLAVQGSCVQSSGFRYLFIAERDLFKADDDRDRQQTDRTENTDDQ